MDDQTARDLAAAFCTWTTLQRRSYGKTESVKARALLPGVTKESTRYSELLPVDQRTTGWFCDRCKEVFAHEGRPDCCMLCGFDGKKKGTKMPKKRLTHKQRRAACQT